MRQTSIIIILAILICLYSVANAEIYQWVDEDGVLHFSNDNVVFSADGVKRTGEVVSPPDQSESVSSEKVLSNSNDESVEEIIGEHKKPIIITGGLKELERKHEDRMKELLSDLYEKENALRESERLKVDSVKPGAIMYHRQVQRKKERDEDIFNKKLELNKVKKAINEEEKKYNDEKRNFIPINRDR